ncbi:MAG TPA: hypothetical protein VHS09_02485, partial [Polyangiaceae bacterium]|nr:hypothetical protein [Polyangiaceae bacterium]
SAFAPHEGRAKVFIVRRAEELSISAANALLKTLEEPGARTHFVLLSATADALLPTIRSRTQRVRFGPLPDAVVAELLAARGVEPGLAEETARLSGGSMANAVTLGDPEASALREQFVARALASLETRDLGGALELAEEAKKGDKAPWSCRSRPSRRRSPCRREPRPRRGRRMRTAPPRATPWPSLRSSSSTAIPRRSSRSRPC